jgi:hypothetical protein
VVEVWGFLQDLSVNKASQVLLNLMAIEEIVFVCVDLVEYVVCQHSYSSHVIAFQYFLEVILNLLVVVLLESGVVNLLPEVLQKIPAMLLANTVWSWVQQLYLGIFFFDFHYK